MTNRVMEIMADNILAQRKQIERLERALGTALALLSDGPFVDLTRAIKANDDCREVLKHKDPSAHLI